MTFLERRRFLALAGSALLSGCSLPRGAANGRTLLASATAPGATGDYAIYPVTKDLLPQVARWPMTGSGPQGGWLSAGGGRGAATIRPGDTLDLTVWDSGETSLLVGAGQKAVPLTRITVAPDGRIFVPYLDRVEVAGQTVEAARADLQTRMAAIAPSAQVQLALGPGRGNAVDVVGGVASPGNYPLSDQPLTLLGALALADGALPGADMPLVRLMRGGKTYVTTLDRVYQDAGLDPVLQGGDRIILDVDRRSFVALGAAGREQIVPFPADRPSALQAMAAAGGVNDARGDPKAVLVLREYPVSVVRPGGPSAARVIFVIDLTTADGLFSAGRFTINPDDVVYVSESPLTGVRTVTQTIGAIFGVGVQAGQVAE